MADTTPYEPVAFQQKLEEVQGRLAELRYIDRATEYLERNQAQWYHQQPIGDLIMMEVPFGHTVPFSRTYSLGVPPFRWPWETAWAFEDEVKEHLRQLAEEAGSWAAEAVAALKTRTDPLTHSWSARYETELVVPLDDAHLTLEDEVSTDFGLLAGSITQWSGDAAENFRTYFYNPFGDTLRSHLRLIEALAGGVVAAKAIVDATQHSLMEAVCRTSELLYHQLLLRSQQKVEDKTLPIVILAAGGLASIISAGAATPLWAIGMEAAAVGLSLASTSIPDGAGTQLVLFGDSADVLLASLETALGGIEDNMVQQYDELAGHVAGVLDRVRLLRTGSDGDDGRLIPMQPTIVDGVDAETFFLPDGR